MTCALRWVSENVSEWERVRETSHHLQSATPAVASRNSVAHDLHLFSMCRTCLWPHKNFLKMIYILYTLVFEKLVHHISTDLPAKERTVLFICRIHLWGVATADCSLSHNSFVRRCEREGNAAAGVYNGVTGVWVCEWTEGKLFPHPLLLFQPIINKHDKHLVCKFREMHLCKPRRAAGSQGRAALGWTGAELRHAFLKVNCCSINFSP